MTTAGEPLPTTPRPAGIRPARGPRARGLGRLRREPTRLDGGHAGHEPTDRELTDREPADRELTAPGANGSTAASLRPARSGPWWLLAAAWPVLTGGALLVAWSYSLAATSSTTTRQSQFTVFWAGVLLVSVPTFVVGVARRTRPNTRLVWVLAYGLFTFVPKLLRDPSMPLYYDEVAHWRQTTNLVASGHLFQPNALIGIIADFPGLHVVTAAISASTGLSVWHSAEIVLLLAHLAALFGAVALGEAIFGSLRAGVTTGLVYSLNSSFMYFDTEFSYESLGIAFFIWCLACVAWTYRARTVRRRLQWTAAAAVLGCCIVPIHHLSSLFLLVALALVALAALLTRRHRAREARVRGLLAAKLAVGGVLAGTISAWFTLAAPRTYAYLSPYFSGGLGQLGKLWSSSGGGGRSLYSGSTVPRYEQVFAYASPVIVGVLALAGVVAFFRRKHEFRRKHGFRRSDGPGEDWSPARIGLSAFGLIYFATLPFILTASGAEGARRAWGFCYLGLAVLIAPVLLAVVDSPRWHGRSARHAAISTAAVCAACVLLIGNVSAGLDEEYRFPGPYVYGADTRAVTPELTAAANWLAHHVPGRQMIVTDRYTSLAFVYRADSWTATPSPGFPAYDLFFHHGPPSARLVSELSTSHYTYLVIDNRMAKELPAQGEYFVPDEPTSRITPADLEQYLHLPWTTRVYQSDHYSIYRFDFAAIGAHVTGGTR